MNWWKQHGTKVLGAIIGLFGFIESLSPGEITSFLTMLFGDRGPGMAVSVLGWITFIRGFINSRNLKNNPPNQAGNARLAFLTVLVWLTACTALGLKAPQSLDEQLAAADKAVTAAATSADTALEAHEISGPQAQHISTMLHQVVPFLDDARAAERAGDTAGATRNFQLAQAVLTSLQTYLAAQGGQK